MLLCQPPDVAASARGRMSYDVAETHVTRGIVFSDVAFLQHDYPTSTSVRC